MCRLTERHCGVAVIKDKSLLKEAMEKLASYEEAEEQGMLLKPPCKVGDEVWILFSNGEIEMRIVEEIVFGSTNDRIVFSNDAWFTIWEKDYTTYFKHVFQTKEEAELTKFKGEQDA